MMIRMLAGLYLSNVASLSRHVNTLIGIWIENLMKGVFLREIGSFGGSR